MSHFFLNKNNYMVLALFIYFPRIIEKKSITKSGKLLAKKKGGGARI